MNLTDALARLTELVNPAASPALSNTDLRAALDASQIPDAAGVWPGRDGYQPTYDVLWAAAETCVIRAMRASLVPSETVTRIESEGSSFAVQQSGPDWGALAHRWRTQSQIGQQIGYGDLLGVVEIEQPDIGYVPASKALQSWT